MSAPASSASATPTTATVPASAAAASAATALLAMSAPASSVSGSLSASASSASSAPASGSPSVSGAVRASLNLQSLVCPFSLDWLEGAIALPCGHILSRAPISQWVGQAEARGEVATCPLCREPLQGFDPAKAATLTAVDDLASQARDRGLPLPHDEETTQPAASSSSISAASASAADAPLRKPKWKASVTRLTAPNRSSDGPQLGRLKIENSNSAFLYQTAIIAVADCSGSMEGRPIEQVQTSLRRLLERTYASRHLNLSMVAYSTKARSIRVDTANPVATYERWVNDLNRGMASTSFRAAFEEIVRLCDDLRSNPNLSRLEILFLTDGEDDEQDKVKRMGLVGDLKKRMSQVWSARPYTVHSIGLGASHDMQLLQQLTSIGTRGEGAYRYANPDLNIDALSAKIASVMDVVTSASAIPMELVPLPQLPPPMVLLPGENGLYWIALPGQGETHITFGLSVDGAAPDAIVAEIVELHDDSALWQEWLGLQVDQAFDELRMLSSEGAAGGGVDRLLHFALLRERSQALAGMLPADSSHSLRLALLLDWLTRAEQGQPLDQMELNDLKFEGKYATKTDPNAGWIPTGKGGHKAMPTVIMPKAVVARRAADWPEENLGGYEKTCGATTILVQFGLDQMAENVGYNFTVVAYQGAQELARTDSVRILASGDIVYPASASSRSADKPTIVSLARCKKLSALRGFIHPGLRADRLVAKLVSEADASELVCEAAVPQRDLAETALGLLAHRSADDVIQWAREHPWQQVRDANGSTLVHICAFTKRSRVLQVLLQLQSQSQDPEKLDLRSLNKHGHNALDAATLGGNWMSFDMLVAAGLAAPASPGENLLRTVLTRAYCSDLKRKPLKNKSLPAGHQNKWLALAKRLLATQLATISDRMVAGVPQSNVLAMNFLTSHGNKSMDLLKAVEMGMMETVQELVAKRKQAQATVAADGSSSSSASAPTLQTWGSSFASVFSTPTADHVRVADFLLAQGVCDPDETIQTKVNVVENNHLRLDKFEPEITWPLYAAAEKGQTSMVKVLLPHLTKGGDKSKLNRQNLQGTTALWIACANGHVDVVLALLEAGADPNLANAGGSSPLIPCCKKGLTTCAELLLEFKLDVRKYNPERDHPILQCCRDGQASMLDLLCRHIQSTHDRDPESIQPLEFWLRKANAIDGYVPLVAAAELNHHECLRTLVKYGAELEARTDADNAIIGGATALHVACFNGHLRSMQVLVELGADVTARTGSLGRSLMHLAVIKRSAVMLRWLRALPADQVASLNCKDHDLRLPAYYASQEGNEAIRDEFFSDRLSDALRLVVHADQESARRCSAVLSKYGRTVGAFDYSRVHGRIIDPVGGVPLLTQALLAGNHPLVSVLRQMGANPLQVDDCGRPALLWSKLLGSESPAEKSLAVPASLQAMLDRVTRAMQGSSQNRMLLSLARGPPARALKPSAAQVRPASSIPTPQLTAPSVLDKMADGFAVQLAASALRDIQKAASAGDLSLLGWTEKAAKMTNVFPDGRESIEQLLWQAKVHVVGLIAVTESKAEHEAAAAAAAAGGASASSPSLAAGASSSSPSSIAACPPGGSMLDLGAGGRPVGLVSASLDPIHLLSLYLYTAHSGVFKQVNATLANWNNPAAAVWHPFVACVYQALDRLPPFEGECFRGVDSAFDPVGMALGQVVCWSSFGQGSLHWNTCTELLKRKRGVMLLIKARAGSGQGGKCRLLSPYASNPADGQVATLPGARFQVTNHFVADPIALAQANIREKTYKLSEVQYAKVLAGGACIVVELTEMPAEEQ